MGRESRIGIDDALEVRLEPGASAALDLAAEAADPRHVFLRRAWYAGHAGAEAVTLAAHRREGTVIAALPTVAVGPRWLGLRAVPGSYWPFRSFPIAADADDAEIEAMLTGTAARRALGRVWRLGPVPADDPALVRLHRIAERCGFSVLSREVGIDFVLDLAGAGDEQGWPRTSTRRNMHKHRKRLARLGDVEFRFITGDDWSPAVFDALAQVERQSWVGSRDGADAKFLDPRMRGGWQAMAADPTLAEMLGVGLLSIGGRPVAFSFGVDCGGTRHCLATSYDADFARHSPGYLAGYLTYEAAAARGVGRLSLGAGDGGEKGSMGAQEGAALVDCLFLRSKALARLMAPLWRTRS